MDISEWKKAIEHSENTLEEYSELLLYKLSVGLKSDEEVARARMDYFNDPYRKILQDQLIKLKMAAPFTEMDIEVEVEDSSKGNHD